jgi:hypothetical protein
MGESSAETVREIEDTRDKLDAELRELEQRIPQPAVWAKRAIGFAVGGGTAAVIALSVLRRKRKKKKQAQAAAAVPAVIQVLPDRWAEQIGERLEDGRWKGYAAGAAGLYVLLRLAEIRQLRRMNKALIAGAR